MNDMLGNVPDWVSAVAQAILAVIGLFSLIKIKRIIDIETTIKKIMTWIVISSAAIIILFIAIMVGYLTIKSLIRGMLITIVGVSLGLILMIIDKIIDKMKKSRNSNTSDSKKCIETWPVKVVILLIIVTLIVTMVSIQKLSKLPTTTMRNSETIARNIKEDILIDTQEDHEKITIALADSEAARKAVYRDAFDQAMQRRYIFSNNGWVLTSNFYREGRRLLTENQRRAVRSCFTENAEEDLYKVMYSVLNDEGVVKTMKDDKADINIPQKGIIHLTPYDIIAVVAGYIGELKSETERYQ